MTNMVGVTSRQVVVLVLAVILLLGGVSVGVWNYNSVQDCKEEFPPGPDTHADCEDALSIFFQIGSILSVITGLIAMGWVFYKRRE